MRPMMWLGHVALGLACLGLAALPRAAAANCGAEGCPLAVHGPEAAAGRFSFDVGSQYVEANRIWDGTGEVPADRALAAEGGAGHVLEQLTLTRTLLFNARARVNDRLSLTASWPYIDRIHRHALDPGDGTLVSSEWHIQGPGDATLLANLTVLSTGGPAASRLTLRLGAKLPTGARHVAEIDGEEPEPPVRPGTGSSDALLGAQYSRRFGVRSFDGARGMAPISVDATARVNGRGTDAYRVGNQWDVNLGAAYPLVRRVQLLGQLNGTWRGRDDVGNTDAEPQSTGSAALFASPGLGVQVLPGMSLFGYYQLRLAEHTNGPQLVAPYHVSFGISYAIGE